MSEITSPILFEAAVSYANETSDASIRGDLRIAFVAGAEWQWKRISDEEAVARLEAENDRLRKALEFYADRDFDGYDITVTDYGLGTQTGVIIKDGGEIARAALEPKP